jgi:hypothetical protein
LNNVAMARKPKSLALAIEVQSAAKDRNTAVGLAGDQRRSLKVRHFVIQCASSSITINET